jgi:hypothetical protein
MGLADGGAAAAEVDLVVEPGRPPDEVPGRVGEPPGRWSSALRFARDVWPALAVYAAIRLVGLVALTLMAGQHGYAVVDRLGLYDARWLLGLADHGYDPLVVDPVDGRPALTNNAFFPLYPAVVKVVAALPGVSLLAAGLFVTAVSSLAAAAGLDRFGRRLVGGRTAGLLLVALWANWPHSVVLLMAYTEALFVALAVWSLLALLAQRWIVAGMLCLLAGATRPLGVALAGAVVVTALAAVVQSLRDRRGVPWRPAAAAVLAPCGFLGFWAYLWARTGQRDAWFWVQSQQWRSTFDFGRYTWQSIVDAATEPLPRVLVVSALVVVGSVVLLVALLVDRTPLPVMVYAVLAVAETIGAAGYGNSKPRFLLCAFPLVLPLVRTIAGAPRRTLVVLLAGLTVVIALYNAWVLVVWPLSP